MKMVIFIHSKAQVGKQTARETVQLLTTPKAETTETETSGKYATFFVCLRLFNYNFCSLQL